MTLAPAALAANAPVASRVDVAERDGIYRVTAAFEVVEAPEVVITVLTDYDRIPKFMPDVRVSKIVERTATGLVVEQEAVSKFMMFSKRVHLLLDVRETGGVIRFTDTCGESFVSYEGSWTISRQGGVTTIGYELAARPSFDVPAFVLKRLLKRDSGLLIDRIKNEIAARGSGRGGH